MDKTSNNHLVNFIAGVTQGSLVTLVGYPFDTIKVKLQSKIYPTSLSALTKILQNEGIYGLYRGGTMPWISHLVKRPLQFPLVEHMKNMKEFDSLGTSKNFVIGIMSGFTGPIFGTPLQVMKVRAQSDKTIGRLSLVKLFSQIKNESGLMGFYRGFVPTLFKDSLFGASFVGWYFTFRDNFGSGVKRYQLNDKLSVPIPLDFIFGATAHCLTWATLIPIDFVKTNVQKSTTKTTITQVIAENYSKHGLKVFWKGIIPASLRTIPVSGIAMTGYEIVRKELTKIDQRN